MRRKESNVKYAMCSDLRGNFLLKVGVRCARCASPHMRISKINGCGGSHEVLGKEKLSTILNQQEKEYKKL